MKQVNKCWVPDAERATGYLESLPLIDGFPGYQRDRFEACIKAVNETRPGRTLQTAIDGGAHVGLWTVPLIRAGFSCVHAFEPIAELVTCIRRNIADHATPSDCAAFVHQEALGDKPGKVPITGSPSKSVTWQLGIPMTTSPKLQTRNARVIKLDSLVLQTVDLIKLDVEGHEHAALSGALDTIARCRPVIMIEEKHDATNAASRLLSDLGYSCTWRKKHDLLWVYQR